MALRIQKEPTTEYSNSFLYRNRGYFIIGVISILSFLYLYFVVSTLVAATSPACVDGTKTHELHLPGAEMIPIACKPLSLNEVGDYFAGLVSLLATLWLIVAFVWQAMELAFQRREFRESNSIALSRAASEDIWRKLEFHEMLREKLGRTVNEICSLRAKIENRPEPAKVVVISDLLRLAKEQRDQYDSSDFEVAQMLNVNRLNTLIGTSRGILLALEKLESDEDLKDFLELFN